MSTKIYNAYRIRPGHNVWDVTYDIRDRVESFCYKRLETVYRALLIDGVARGEVRKTLTVEQRQLHVGHVSAWVRERFRQQRGAYERNQFDLSVSVAVHRVGRVFLLRAFSGSGYFHDALKFLERYRAVVDFHYQDQADRPKNITAQAWRERRRLWERAMREDGTPDHQLVMEIVTPETWDRIDPAFAMERQQRRSLRKLSA